MIQMIGGKQMLDKGEETNLQLLYKNTFLSHKKVLPLLLILSMKNLTMMRKSTKPK